MQMCSAENPGKENRGFTLIPCSFWRASSSDVRYRDVLHAAAVEVSVQGMSLLLALHLQHISLDAHPLKPNKALHQAQPLLSWSSNAWHPKASFLRPRAARALSVPRRWPRPQQKATHAPAENVPQWPPACTCLHTRRPQCRVPKQREVAQPCHQLRCTAAGRLPRSKDVTAVASPTHVGMFDVSRSCGPFAVVTSTRNSRQVVLRTLPWLAHAINWEAQCPTLVIEWIIL